MADPPRYRIIVIDPPAEAPDFTAFPEPYMGINNRGEVVSTVYEDGVYYPFVWLPAYNPNYDDGNGLTYGTYSLPTERVDFQARAINVNGIAVGRGLLDEDGTSAISWNLNLALEDSFSMVEIFDCDCDGHMHKEEATDINDNDPPLITGSGWLSYSPFVQRAFRKEFGTDSSGTEILGPVLVGHNLGLGTAISNSGLVAGTSSSGSISYCGEEQNVFRAATWAGNSTSADNLSTLGTSLAEAFTTPRGINNADPNMIVGFGDDPSDLSQACRRRALFWEDSSATPITLPYLDEESPEPMQAFAIADPFADGSIRVAGHAEYSNAAVLWVRTDDTWDAIDLNALSPCNTDSVVWANLDHAFDINSCGWIAGTGVLSDDSPRAFVLIPTDMWPGDLVGSSSPYPDGAVNTSNLLYVIIKWSTSDCVADINGDSTVGTPDLLAVINAWGPCPCFPSLAAPTSPAQSTPSGLSQALTAANLTEEQWNDFMDVMASGTQSEQENYLCWMQRYLSGCTECPTCPGSNPFQH